MPGCDIREIRYERGCRAIKPPRRGTLGAPGPLTERALGEVRRRERIFDSGREAPETSRFSTGTCLQCAVQVELSSGEGKQSRGTLGPTARPSGSPSPPGEQEQARSAAGLIGGDVQRLPESGLIPASKAWWPLLGAATRFRGRRPRAGAGPTREQPSFTARRLFFEPPGDDCDQNDCEQAHRHRFSQALTARDGTSSESVGSYGADWSHWRGRSPIPYGAAGNANRGRRLDRSGHHPRASCAAAGG